jgi:hypothetical protein
MRPIVRVFTWALFAGAGPVVLTVTPASAPQPELASADVATYEYGYRTGRLQGSKVFNEGNERIGTIADFVLVGDMPPAAILQVGAFLETGSHFVAVPFKNFVIENAGARIVLPGATREALRSFPEFRFRH